MEYYIEQLTTDTLNNTTGLLETLANMRETHLQEQDLPALLEKINKQDGHIYVAIRDQEIIGSTTVLIEQKFIHHGGLVAHIEDVVTKKAYEGNGVAKNLLNTTLEYARLRGCYKAILDCSEQNKELYEKIGFRKAEEQMRIDL